MATLKRILVPVDFSDCSRDALRRADELGKTFGAKVDVVHVWQAPAFISPEAMVGVTPQQGQTLAQLAEQQAEKSLQSFVAHARNAGVHIDSARTCNGEPAHAIVDEAEHGDYDLIAMGTHGRTGLSQLLLGSVAEKVVRRATRPVMTVRSAPLPRD
jgi:nucleotide-binding universal stress UspA family protein